MVRTIRCDVCGKEISSQEVYARLTYKTEVKSKTKTGKVTVKKITRSADFCSKECYDKFKPEE
jgi:DNA-directed RNA polymerase subunit N (RpoN/RPB10)